MDHILIEQMIAEAVSVAIEPLENKIERLTDVLGGGSPTLYWMTVRIRHTGEMYYYYHYEHQKSALITRPCDGTEHLRDAMLIEFGDDGFMYVYPCCSQVSYINVLDENILEEWSMALHPSVQREIEKSAEARFAL